MKRAVLLLMALAVGAFAFANDLQDDAKELAKRELDYHLGLLAERPPHRFVFGKPADAPDPQPCESRYRIAGDTVWFWGDDGGVGALRRNGTFFAVSLFLERELGFRWLWPGESGLVVPRTAKPVLPERSEGRFQTALDKSELRVPRGFKLQDWGEVSRLVPDVPPAFTNHARSADVVRAEHLLWQKRMRLQDRTSFSYGHAFTDWKRRFGKTHPEYLNLTHGERGWHGGEPERFVHLCVSNEDVVDQVIRDWCGRGTNRYLNVCENDGSATYCQCPACTALDVPDADPNAPVKHRTDRYVNFWNRVARKARAIRPDVMLVAYLYSEYRLPPRRERIEFPDNLICGSVPSPVEDTAAMYRGWFAAGLRHFFLRPNHHHWLGMVPRGYEKRLYDEFHDCLALGMTGVDYDAPFVRPPMAIEFYVTAKMVADPTLPFEQIVSEYYSGYGEAAEDVRAYFEAVREAGDRARAAFDAAGEKLDHSQLAHAGRPWQIWGRTEEDVAEKKAMVERALAKHGPTMDAASKARLENLVLQNEHALLTFRFLDAMDRNLPQEEKEARAFALLDFRVAHAAELPDDYMNVIRCWWGEIQTWRHYRTRKKKAAASADRTKVVFFFDTEDFIQPRSADAIRDIANILRSEGVRGHFAMIGYLGKKLVDWRRTDVLDALKHHLVGTQTLYHSLHPNITESTDIEDYARAREIAFDEECRAIGMLQAATGQERMWCSVLPGNGNTIVALYLYADLGIPFFGGGTGMYEDETKCGDIWYCNQRHLNYAYNMHLESFIPNYIGMRDIDRELDVLAKQKVATLYMHPHMAVCQRHWDWVFRGGNNYAFGKWPFAPARDAADTAVFYERLRAFIRRLKADRRFEITDCERLYAEQKPRRTIRRADVPAIRKALRASLGPVRAPGEWCVADAFQAAVRFLGGADAFEPGKAYGFLYEPKGVSARCTVTAADLRAAAAKLDIATFVPASIEVGGRAIGPADFLFAALEVLETGAAEVALEPRDQLGEIARYLPKMARANFRKTWIYTDDYKDEWTSNRLRWQFWTFRYE